MERTTQGRKGRLLKRNRTLAFGLAGLTLTGTYLYALPAATIFYFAVVLGHIVGGLALSAVLLFYVFRLRSSVFVPRLGWVFIASGMALGIVLIFTGAARPLALVFYSHILLCAIGVILLLTDYAGRRGWARSTMLRFSAFASLALLLGVLAWAARELAWRGSHQIKNPEMPPEAQRFEGEGIQGAFFPSSVRTSTGGKLDSQFFMQSEACRRCHSDIYEQWSGSAHRFSSFNNQWYRKSIEYMQDVIGVQPSKWCAGCHDPALLLSGKFEAPVREIADTPEGQAGLGCVACHSISSVNSTMGQADYTLEYPALAKMAASRNRLSLALHDFLVQVNPEPHRRTFMRPFIREQTSEFCSTCHKVHLDEHVNNYRWLRGFNDYDNWQASGVSGMGARSFYYPAESKTCTGCHMPWTDSMDAGNHNGKVHSHRFPAANTALPVANQDAAQREAVTRFLQDGILSVDIFGISPARSAGIAGMNGGEALPSGAATLFAVGEEANSQSVAATTELAPLTAPLDRVEAQVLPGETYRVDVVVRTRKVGHFFPGGTTDAFDVWLELQATDENGRTIFSSGSVAGEGKGPVDPAAHFYRSLLVDAKGNPINKRNAWAARSLVYVRLIPPGAADTVHYRIHIPKESSGRIQLKTRLLYRKFAWWNTQFSFAGERLPGTPAPTKDYDNGQWVFTAGTSGVSARTKGIPDLPIITLAEDTVNLQVAAGTIRDIAAVTAADRADWERWNDYGIGLFLQGDLKGAESAFNITAQIAPDNPDGWVNIGRVRVAEGDLDGGKKVLDRALSIAPRLARAQFFYAQALKEEGAYDEALSRLKIVLEQYPRDRVARSEAGRVLFLQKKYEEAIREFRNVLEIDPEDLQAHYNLMLCYNGLGNDELAQEHQKRYLRFKADEASQAITGPYRQAHSEDNNERQSIHEHVSEPLAALRSTR
jgi:tetratricopeptide (TPR) repeat protein